MGQDLAKRIEAADSAEADRILDEVLLDGPKDYEQLRSAAQICMGAGKFDASIRLWSTLASVQAYRLEAEHNRGTCLLRLARFDEATDAFAGLREAFPNAPNGYVGLAMVLVEMGDLEAASLEFSRCLDLFPNHKGARFMRAKSLRDLGRSEDAVHELRPCLEGELPFSIAGFWELLGALQETGRLRESTVLVHQVFAFADTPASQAPKTKYLILGNSHLGAIQEAYLSEGGNEIELDFHFLDQSPITDAAGALTGTYRALLELARGSAGVFLAVGGNEHTVLGLAKHPIEYWITRPPMNSEVSACSPRMSRSLVHAMLRDRMRPGENLIRLIYAMAPGRVFVLDSPPPCPSSSHILETIDPVLSDAASAYGITDAYDRLEMWRLRSKIAQEMARQLASPFFSVPPSSQDGEGFLRQDCWGNATHGNANYGRLVLEQIQTAARNERTRQ